MFYDLDNYENEQEIHEAFRNFIHRRTGWYIVREKGEYVGKTKERYLCFRSGYLAGKGLIESKFPIK